MCLAWVQQSPNLNCISFGPALLWNTAWKLDEFIQRTRVGVVAVLQWGAPLWEQHALLSSHKEPGAGPSRGLTIISMESLCTYVCLCVHCEKWKVLQSCLRPGSSPGSSPGFWNLNCRSASSNTHRQTGCSVQHTQTDRLLRPTQTDRQAAPSNTDRQTGCSVQHRQTDRLLSPTQTDRQAAPWEGSVM